MNVESISLFLAAIIWISFLFICAGVYVDFKTFPPDDDE